MRALAILCLSLAPVAPALAQPALRGPVEAAPTKASAPATPPVPVAAPLMSPLPATPAPQAADQCRTTCARQYYFCLAGDSPEACPDAWGQCRTGCTPRASLLTAPAR